MNDEHEVDHRFESEEADKSNKDGEKIEEMKVIYYYSHDFRSQWMVLHKN